MEVVVVPGHEFHEADNTSSSEEMHTTPCGDIDEEGEREMVGDEKDRWREGVEGERFREGGVERRAGRRRRNSLVRGDFAATKAFQCFLSPS